MNGTANVFEPFKDCSLVREGTCHLLVIHTFREFGYLETEISAAT